LAKVIGCGLASCQGKLTEIEDDPVPVQRSRRLEKMRIIGYWWLDRAPSGR